MNNKLVKIGVIGVGHLGQHHVKHFKNLKSVDLIGIYDTNKDRALSIAKKYNVDTFDSINSLITKVEAVSIVAPTIFHSEIATLCIKNKKHVFIEKPITATIEEANNLLKLAKLFKIIIQVGHIERLNPALLALEPFQIKPKFIEFQRLAPYTTRGTDVPVVLDKMIHDIDILLSLVDSKIDTIQATGLSILTDSVDIAHARLRFENGTVASIMSSRIAKDEVRKVKLFQKDLYTTIDLLLGLTEVYQMQKENIEGNEKSITIPFNYKEERNFISYYKPPLSKKDPLLMELDNFILSIQKRSKPIVTGKDGRDALDIALKIQEKIMQDLH